MTLPHTLAGYQTGLVHGFVIGALMVIFSMRRALARFDRDRGAQGTQIGGQP
jgi:hypothetical protein